jgi:uncharacterized protein (TIGR03435 family)
MPRVLATAAALIAIGAGSLRAQSPPPASAAGALPSFEAASIRPVEPVGRPIDLRFFPNRFNATTVTLSQLIEQAYGLQPREIVGGPDWVRVERFDVTATAGTEVPPPQMRLMLQKLLAERFQLELNRQTTTGTVYRLTAVNPRNLTAPAKPDGRSIVATMREDGNGVLSYHYDGINTTMAALALTLAQHVRAPVTDETNLTGHYDFRINWTYDEPFGGLQPDPNLPTIFTALERDLGLKLVADQGSIPVHVIRRVSKPSAN